LVWVERWELTSAPASGLQSVLTMGLQSVVPRNHRDLQPNSHWIGLLSWSALSHPAVSNGSC
jgi:hypothetical protein